MSYYVFHNNEVKGPFTLGTLQQNLNLQVMDASTPVCAEGTDEWGELGDLFQVAFVPKNKDYLSAGRDMLNETRQFMLSALKKATKGNTVKGPSTPAVAQAPQPAPAPAVAQAPRVGGGAAVATAPRRTATAAPRVKRKKVRAPGRSAQGVKVVSSGDDLFVMLAVGAVLVLIVAAAMTAFAMFPRAVM